MNLNDFLLESTIEEITVVRGLGLIPAYMRLTILKDCVKYFVETEVNFRIIYKKQMILCFDDMFLDKNYEEISVKKYRSQVGNEKTLIQLNLKNSCEKICGKKIKKIKVTQYGDIILYVSANCKLQIINDTHLNDSCIFRILSESKCKELIVNCGKKFFVEDLLYEVTNKNNCIEINNNLNI